MRRPPLLLRIAGGVVLAVLVAHAAGWWWLSRQVRDGFTAWSAAQPAFGRTVESGSPALSGWPFAGGITVPGLTVRGPGWEWTADHARLTVRPWAPGRLRVEPSGHQTLVAGSVQLALDARALLLTLALPGGDDPMLDADSIRLSTPLGPATADRAEGRLSPDRASLSLDGISLPPGQPYLLGPAISSLRFDASANRPLPPPAPAALRAWRDAGGAVGIDSAHLAWGALRLDATGTATLDAQLQPVSDLQVRMAGQDQALDAAATAGLISPRTVLAIRAVLGLLSGARNGGGGKAVPATLHGSVLAVAGFPVARVPTVVWP